LKPLKTILIDYLAGILSRKVLLVAFRDYRDFSPAGLTVSVPQGGEWLHAKMLKH
jgi:hypothetical protein